jgi:polysaccharide biosynthesis transport protein
MTDSHTDHAIRQLSLSDYVRILRRRKGTIVGMTVLVTALAVAFSLNQSKVYKASTQVLINRQDLAATATGTPVDPSLGEDPARFATTLASVARSYAVAQLAISKGKVAGRTAGGLLAHSTVTPNPNADLLVFTVNDGDPLKAAKLANAYAAAYAAYRLKLETSTLAKARNELLRRINNVGSHGDRTSALYRSLTNSEQQLHTMELLQSQDTVLIHPSAGTRVQPTPRRDGFLGLGFGLLLGVAVAFVSEALDKRIRLENEVERELDLPLLARLPEPPRGIREGVGLSMIDHPGSMHADAARRLATNIEFTNPDRPSQVIMFTSAVQREGKSTAISDLAVALARSGRSVALVDLDLRQPKLASLFGIHRLTGLTDVVMGQVTLDDALVSIELPETRTRRNASSYAPGSLGGRLSVLPTGTLPATPGEFVAAEALVWRVLSPLRKRFDYVLIDAPPICVVGDAQTLSARVDSIVAVVRLGVIDRTALTDLKRELAASPAPTIGFVLTGTDAPDAYGYGPRLTDGNKPSSEPKTPDGATTAARRPGRVPK